MLRRRYLLEDRQPTLIESFRQVIFALNMVERCQVAEADRDLVMFRPQYPPLDRQRIRQKVLGTEHLATAVSMNDLLILPLIRVEYRQVIHAHGSSQVFRSQYLLPDSQGKPVE